MRMPRPTMPCSAQAGRSIAWNWREDLACRLWWIQGHGCRPLLLPYRTFLHLNTKSVSTHPIAIHSNLIIPCGSTRVYLSIKSQNIIIHNPRTFLYDLQSTPLISAVHKPYVQLSPVQNKVCSALQRPNSILSSHPL
jgi:hypothetical protein